MRKSQLIKITFFVIFFLFFIKFVNVVWKIPLNVRKVQDNELSANYYKGLLGGLYLRGIRDCSGWLISTCDMPDLFPFLQDRLIKDSDPNSFAFLGSYSKPHDWTANADIYRDKNYVIIYDKVITNSDPSSIQIMDGYAKDKNNVYKGGSVLSGLDTKTFELLGCGLFRDASNIYHFSFENGKKPIDIIDIESFEMIDRNGKACNLVPYVAKDKFNLYQSDTSGIIIVEADSSN